MTVTDIAKRVEASTRSPRRLLVIIILLVIIAAMLLWYLMRNTTPLIEYPEKYLTATPAAVCPGEAFTYPVSIAVEQGDSISRVTEGWCRTADGICPKALQTVPYYVNFVEAYGVSTMASRTVPADMAPGDWQLRHCNETHASGVIDVVCYAVNVTVKDCTP